jgi:hypothetical protein
MLQGYCGHKTAVFALKMKQKEWNFRDGDGKMTCRKGC